MTFDREGTTVFADYAGGVAMGEVVMTRVGYGAGVPIYHLVKLTEDFHVETPTTDILRYAGEHIEVEEDDIVEDPETIDFYIKTYGFAEGVV